MSGRLITIEGIDGAGKTTQAQLLGEYLINRGLAVVTTREPGGTAISERIRAILLDPAHRNMSVQAEVLLYAAARAQLVAEVIKPALAAGQVVICDRFIDSTLAYQGAGRGLDQKSLGPVINLATGGLEPDLTLLLDLDPAEGQNRIRQGRIRNGGPYNDRLEQESLEFYQRVRNSFLTLARQNPNRIKVIAAAQPREAVWAEIKATVDELFSF
ncbi:MAG: dTMP kinase [Firmicutes bacterium]|nr:dTMP kinase [Bacillota bacterium]